MSEDKFEEFLQREAQAYNPPPATAPRDEMWAAIQRSRETARPDIASTLKRTIRSMPAISIVLLASTAMTFFFAG